MSKGSEARRKADDIVGGRVDKLVRALTFDGLGRIMQKTPVDKGTARANWNVSENNPDYSTNPEATIADVPAKLTEGGGNAQTVGFWAGETAWIANGLDYIERLEDGYSKQAPAGMVKVTVEELKPVADQIASRLNTDG